MIDDCLTSGPVPSLSLVTPPSIEPLTLTEVKLYLRVDSTTEDSLITGLITAAREIAESYTKRSFITQTWMLSYDCYCPERVLLPRGPIQSVTSVVVVNRDNTTTTFSSSQYYLGALGNELIFDVIPLGSIVQITYQTGYGAAETNVPLGLRTGMMAHIAEMYENRSGSISVTGAIAAYYDPYKVMKI